MECIEPPMPALPDKDWQCALCKANQITGVSDCSSALEKSNILYRQEHLGYDRHGRKYWFLARRLFVYVGQFYEFILIIIAWFSTFYSENEDGDIWYYSTEVQLENLLRVLDEDDMEYMLCREISEFRDEINRQMEITEKVTVSQKGNKKSYIDSENGIIKQQLLIRKN
jgi:nucleosome-remodeling factor subunit BPTF